VRFVSFMCFFHKFFMFDYAHHKEKFEIVTNLVDYLQNSFAFVQICSLINMGGISITIEIVILLFWKAKAFRYRTF